MSPKHLVKKSAEVNGATYWFREITAGERLSLLKGQKISKQGNATSFEFDLSLNEEQRQKLVLYSVCKEDGSAHFSDLKSLQHESARLVGKLYVIAEKVNDEEEEPGNG